MFQVYGLGTDGANVMASDQNGLNGLRAEVCPFCNHVHCVCHRLALAVKQAGNEIPLVKSMETLVQQVYHIVQRRQTVHARYRTNLYDFYFNMIFILILLIEYFQTVYSSF